MESLGDSCRVIEPLPLRASLRGTPRSAWTRSSCAQRADMGRIACVYSGEGAGQRSLLSAREALEEALPSVEIRQLDTAELLEAEWQQDCLLLCMPGGADLPYCRHLNGRGNALIKEYVQRGGSYLGLCAGGYYACSQIEFEPGTRLEVKGSRELAFFPGMARGAVYPGFAYQTEAGARAAPLCFLANGGKQVECRDYCNGGPAFIRNAHSASDSAKDLAHFSDGSGVAAVRCQVGGGVAVLCGTHPELAPRWLDGACSSATVRKAHPEYSNEKVAQLVDTAKAVRRALEEDASGRKNFWSTLLSAAGLGAFLRT